MDFIIGKAPNSQFLLPPNDDEASRQHAILYRLANGQFEIKDNNSTNGIKLNNVTFRNVTKKIDINTNLQLGNTVINVKELFEKYELVSIDNKTDFKLEFEKLKTKYDAYDLERENIENRFHKQRVIPSLVLGLTAFIANALTRYSKMIENQDSILYTILGLVGTFGCLAPFISALSSSPNKQKKRNQEIALLDNSLEEFWFCPNNKCKRTFRGYTWLTLKHKAKCIHPNCNATW